MSLVTRVAREWRVGSVSIACFPQQNPNEAASLQCLYSGTPLPLSSRYCAVIGTLDRNRPAWSQAGPQSGAPSKDRHLANEIAVGACARGEDRRHSVLASSNGNRTARLGSHRRRTRCTRSARPRSACPRRRLGGPVSAIRLGQAPARADQGRGAQNSREGGADVAAYRAALWADSRLLPQESCGAFDRRCRIGGHSVTVGGFREVGSWDRP